MLIESCVAAPATPNGKPAVPGSQLASAFYSPNRQRQIQSVHGQWSQESQSSTAQSQYAAREPHQIEDAVVVSTSRIETTKSGPSRSPEGSEQRTVAHPLATKLAIKVWVSPLFGENVTEDVKASENSNISQQGDKVPVRPPQTLKGPPIRPDKDMQPSSQGDNIVSDEMLQLMPPGPQVIASPSEESTVVTLFKRLQAFFFSPSSSKLKPSRQSGSSCCERDFNSEYSETTLGSFNPNDELDTLLGDSSQGCKIDSQFLGDYSSGLNKFDSKIYLPMEDDQNDDGNEQLLISQLSNSAIVKTTVEMKEKQNVMRKTCANKENCAHDTKLEPAHFLVEGLTHPEVPSFAIVPKNPETEGFKEEKSEGHFVSTDISNEKTGFNDMDGNEPLIYKTTIVFKIHKETVV